MYKRQLYFSPAEPHIEEIRKSSTQNRFNFFFSYEDIGGIEGVKNWLLRMQLSEIHGWDEQLMVALLLEGHHRQVFATEYNIMPVITAALMLPDERTKSIKGRLQQLIKIFRQIHTCDPYFNGAWCEAIAAIRNRGIAHPESLKGAKFPGSAAFLARELLYRICVSLIIKEMIGLPETQSKSIIQKIWKHHHTQEYLKRAKRDDIKQWFRELPQNPKFDEELEANRKYIFTEAKLPPDFSKLSNNILGSPEVSKSFSIYNYQCPHCHCEWRALKPKKGAYEVSIKGNLNSGNSNVWSRIGIYNKKIEANGCVRKSVSKHFCVPFNKQSQNKNPKSNKQ